MCILNLVGVLVAPLVCLVFTIVLFIMTTMSSFLQYAYWPVENVQQLDRPWGGVAIHSVVASAKAQTPCQFVILSWAIGVLGWVHVTLL